MIIIIIRRTRAEEVRRMMTSQQQPSSSQASLPTREDRSPPRHRSTHQQPRHEKVNRTGNITHLLIYYMTSFVVATLLRFGKL
jgi:hypothetical protein